MEKAFVLALWPIVTLVLFGLLPRRKAAFACLFVGWAFLPTAAFTPSTTQSLMGVALPSLSYFTKASVIGASLLLAIAVFEARALARLRPAWIDLPVAAWCVVPLASALANGATIASAGSLFVYQTLAWGAPWLAGRLYAGSAKDLGSWARGLVLLGLAYLPLVVPEIVAGPFWYALVYGHHSYYGVGVHRYIGYRPIVFLEDGNQLGMWMAVVSVAAVWLWRTGDPVRLGRLPAWVPPLLLVAVTILCQSAGSIVLMAAGIVVLPLSRFRLGRLAIAGLVFVIVAYVIVRGAGWISARKVSEDTAFGREAKTILKRIGKGSFGWRLKEEEAHLHAAWRHPLLGAGRTNWWELKGTVRPWGLWLLAFGTYGLVGLSAMLALLLGPVILFALRRPIWLCRAPPWNASAALAVIVVLGTADALMNSTFLVVLAAVAGGVAGVSEGIGKTGG